MTDTDFEFENENMEELYITDLIQVSVLQKLQDAFSQMTGMAALTTDHYGTPVTEPTNFTDFCYKYTRESPLGLSRCMRCDKMGAEMSLRQKRSCSYHCHAGLIDFAAPIVANGQIIGSFLGGQVLATPPNLSAFEEIANELGIDPEAYKEAVSRVAVVDENTIDKTAQFLYIVAECLSYLAYQSYEVHKSNIEIEKAANMKSDFLANMSHEIRTPMNAVLGLVDLALREQMSSAAKEYLYQIKSSAKNLLVIINDILDFSKIESGKMEIIDVSYEPLSIISDMASIANVRIGTKNIELTVHVSPDIPQSLYGDNVRIHQILLNLVNNAVKFTKSGNVHIYLGFERVDEDHGILKASVTDTGIGIKSENIKKLFNSFQQVDSKRNRNIEGTGLGLAISKNLLELMGGYVYVSSEYGIGSTFSFEVPQKIINTAPVISKIDCHMDIAVLLKNEYVKKHIIKELEWINANVRLIEDLSDIQSVHVDYIISDVSRFKDDFRRYLSSNPTVKCILLESFGIRNEIFFPNVKVIYKPVYCIDLYNALGISDIKSSSKSKEYDSYTFVAPEAQVLIVDDNSVNLKVAAGLIEPLGMHVDTAESASVAIDMLSHKKYDIIFMDHMMPEVDGIEATHIIRRMLPGYSETPIIALTANAVSGARELFLKEGMNDFVAKPIEISEIVSKIRKWLPQEKILPIKKAEKPAESNDTDELKIEGLNVKAAIEMIGNKQLYLSILKDYYDTIEEKARKIQEYRWAENWEYYTIDVHALKSSSRQIGAEYLGELAAELEAAGKANNIDVIREKSDHMIDVYTKYREILAPLFPDDEESQEEQNVSICMLLDKLSASMDSFDVLEIEEVFEDVRDAICNDKCLEYCSKVDKYYKEGDFDKCKEIIEEWKKSAIENGVDTVYNSGGSSNIPDREKLISMLEDIYDAVQSFDILHIDEAVEELSKYEYPEGQKEFFEQIKKSAEESDIDNCSRIALKWKKML